MDICRMDHSCHRKSKCIYNDMFFFFFDLLTSINSAFLTVCMARGSYVSRVYDTKTRRSSAIGFSNWIS